MFCKKSALQNFAEFIGKHLCLRPTTLLKKRLWHRCFPMNFAKFLRTPVLIEHLWWLLLNQGRWFVKQELFERHEPNHMQRGTLLFIAPEQLPGNYPIKQAKLEDLPNHGSFWQLLHLLHTISMAILNHLYLNDIWLFQLMIFDYFSYSMLIRLSEVLG